MAEVSRRAVLMGGVGVLGVAAVGFGDSAVIGRAAAAVPSRSTYVTAIGEVFDATADGRTSRMRLTSAQNLSTSAGSRRSESFVLTFETVDGARPGDAIYSLSGGGVPVHDLFVSATGSESAMQAVVNRTV
ncbi:hypothetical protein IFT73_16880 [Aeromicrobium sp. CFBP 8757]|uniref:DUF6916 family protein n=1 Tax=Aeromicrobium sp. CFBP 8757 TaxID=2775288 RepID=UPI0017813975|nr:hypothetical protein [Aeromicrobium sp. CFBP 8757]MBD8608532.1 hypothetical protein [Aeromicrobium sp. CFBP 8757]